MKKQQRVEMYDYFKTRLRKHDEICYRIKSEVRYRGEHAGYRFGKATVTAKIIDVKKNYITVLVGDEISFNILFKNILYF